MVSMAVSPDADGLLDQVERAVSAFAVVPVGLRPGDAGDRIGRIHRLRARLDGELLGELAAFETSGGHREAGCASVGSWVRLHLRHTHTGAGGLVGVARVLGGLPLVAAALAAGRIGREQVDAVVAGVKRIGAEAMGRHEQTLVDLAAAASAGEVRAAVAEIVRLAEADTDTGDAADARAAKAEASRSFESRRVGDQLVVNAAVDLATGAALTGFIDAHSTPRPAPDGGRDERTATQRRADAFSRLVDTATDTGDLPERVRSKAAVTLTVSVETLLGLPGAGPLLDRLGLTPSETARRLLCDGTLTRIILDPAGEPIDINTAVRSHTTAQARALAIRHSGCVPRLRCAVPELPYPPPPPLGRRRTHRAGEPGAAVRHPPPPPPRRRLHHHRRTRPGVRLPRPPRTRDSRPRPRRHSRHPAAHPRHPHRPTPPTPPADQPG